MKRIIPYLFIVGLSIIFFWQVFAKGLLPIPSDTIVGLYHPYRDLYASNYPNGIPFKNFLITDPVRQTYPWRHLSFNSKMAPSWNPYSFSGAPNIANFQSAVFYPFNLIFLIFPFTVSWTFLIILQPILAGIFMFLYLRNLRLSDLSSFLGGLLFSFGGFFTVWLEWGTILNTALWLPLILLSVDKLFEVSKQINFRKMKINNHLLWGLILLLSLAFSFFAGHLQTFFYIFLLTIAYVLLRWVGNGRKFLDLKPFAFAFLGFFIVSAIQWVPTLQFILLSSRSLDQSYLSSPGWFIPFQNAIQFLIPDFFGNPSTLNYWGTWNYGELTGYVGVLSIILFFYAILYRRSKEVLFFTIAILTSLILAFPDPIAKLPYLFNLPFISTAQPTRLLFVIDFCLAVIAAIGVNEIVKNRSLRKIIVPLVIVALLFGISFLSLNVFKIDPVNLVVSKRNIVFPFAIFVASAVLLLLTSKFKDYSKYLLIALILLTAFDLFRFSWKFNTFSKSEYLYPKTHTISFLKENTDIYRIASNDSRILPPNFSSIYGLASVEGYDPLYLERYAEFISAINRNEPDILPPFGFNRIVRLQRFDSKLVDLLGVKYVLSLTDINDPKFSKVYEEGQTKVYENENVLPRAFTVSQVSSSKNSQETINKMFDPNFNPIDNAIVEGVNTQNFNTESDVSITSYKNDEVKISVDASDSTFLIFTDTYYPTWKARMDGGSNLKIYPTDYNFRGVFVPKGKHTIIFYNSLL